jgi:hypothetical protein
MLIGIGNGLRNGQNDHQENEMTFSGIVFSDMTSIMSW